VTATLFSLFISTFYVLELVKLIKTDYQMETLKLNASSETVSIALYLTSTYILDYSQAKDFRLETLPSYDWFKFVFSKFIFFTLTSHQIFQRTGKKVLSIQYIHDICHTDNAL